MLSATAGFQLRQMAERMLSATVGSSRIRLVAEKMHSATAALASLAPQHAVRWISVEIEEN